MKILHIYASKAVFNSGDYMIGKSYKYKAQKVWGNNITFVSFDCRNSKLYNSDGAIAKLNTFDKIIVGGGGLLLPDSSPNNTSCWQWVINKNYISQITVPIYVWGLGYNVFYGQNMTMTNRNNNNINQQRIPVLVDNLKVLLNKCMEFKMRHKSDVENVLKLVGEQYRNKIQYELCAVSQYVRENWKFKDKGNYIAFEIKDDREWRRYHKIGKVKYYMQLMKVYDTLVNRGEKVVYLSHDGSKNFYRFLHSKGRKCALLDCSVGNENKIRECYSKLKMIMCSAGHSQIMAHGLDIPYIGLVTHPKIRNFCDDIGSNKYVMVNESSNVYEDIMKQIV